MSKGVAVGAGIGAAVGVAVGVGVCAVVGVDWSEVGAGNVAEWFAGLGALAAAVVAVVVSLQAQKAAETAADEARQAASRGRYIGVLVQLVEVVETDAVRFAATGDRDVFAPKGAALCRAAWGYRDLLPVTWPVYCQPQPDDRGVLLDAMGPQKLFDTNASGTPAGDRHAGA